MEVDFPWLLVHDPVARGHHDVDVLRVVHTYRTDIRPQASGPGLPQISYSSLSGPPTRSLSSPVCQQDSLDTEYCNQFELRV